MAIPSFFTLLFALVIAQVFLSTGPGANALQGMNLAAPVVKRAEHAQINERMLKKRRPQDNVATDVPINVGGGDAPTTSPTTSPTTTATTTSTPTTSNSHPTTSASPPPTTSSLSSPPPTVVPTTTSKSTTSTSTTAQTSTAQTSPTTTSTTQPTVLSVLHTTDATGGTIYVTASATDAAQASASIIAAAQDQSFLPKSVIIGLIVTGSCIAAGAAIWTIIRKWKFSPSRHFEDRLEPINWEPTQGSGLNHDPTVAALARAGSKNDTRPSSYLSDEHGGSVNNMSSVHPEQISVAPDFPPAHDFTAGTGGYVDMHRGPSPAPTQYGSAYGGQYETPNPYDAYDYPGYGQRRY